MLKFKPLAAALITAGVLVVGTAGAIEIPAWLKGTQSTSQASSPSYKAVSDASAQPPVAMLPAQGTPKK